MKKITILTFCFATIFAYGQDFYMYVNGQKRVFDVSTTKMIVKSETLNAADIRNVLQGTTSGNVKNVYELHNQFSLIDMQSMSRDNFMDIKKQWSSKEDIIFVSPVFIDENGRTIGGFTNQILIRLRYDTDKHLIARSVVPFQIKDIKRCDFDKQAFLLTVERGSRKSAMQVANELHRTGLFEYVEPNLIHFLELTTNDQHFQHQWGLHHSTAGIRAPQAWGISTGSNIRIAILDNGVDLNHPDLNLLPGFDATGNNSGGAPIGNLDDFAHGTASAGVAAARGNNTIGIAGVAHSSQVLPVRIATRGWGWTTTESEFIRLGINWARENNADVISMSFSCIETTALNTAIVNAVTIGRSNRGIVLVASSGNGWQAIVRYPARHPSVISVGATDNQGRRASFSDHGPNLDIVAPGVAVWTTGMLGATGYGTVINDGVDGVYFTSYTGTSAAAPHVAGVAALILSANPNLTERQVRDIMESTARKLENYTFDVQRPNGSWNNEVGHGLVDAYAAVRAALAMACTSSFINQTVNSNRTIIGCSTLEVRDVNVTNNARLTIENGGRVSLGAGFRVQPGASLEVR